MNATPLSGLIEEAEHLKRQWFKQLQALEGTPAWREGWARYDHLRSLLARAQSAQGEEEKELAANLLRSALQLPKDLLGPSS